MYLNTPSSGNSDRSKASQAPSTSTQAPRLEAYGLPLSPHNPGFPITPNSSGSHAPYHHYGLVTPPDSPDKLPHARGRTLDFHPMLDARGPPLRYDLRKGVYISQTISNFLAINHRASRIRVNMGPNVFSIHIVASNGAQPTLSDVFDQLSAALKMRASPQEVASAIQWRVAAAECQGVDNIRRAGLLNYKFVFAGFTLRSVQNGVAIVDCHLASHL